MKKLGAGSEDFFVSYKTYANPFYCTGLCSDTFCVCPSVRTFSIMASIMTRTRCVPFPKSIATQRAPASSWRPTLSLTRCYGDYRSGGGGSYGGYQQNWYDRLRGQVTVVHVLIGLNVAAFAGYHTVAQSNREVFRFYNRHMILSPSRVTAGYVDCILGSAFMHVMPLHLFFNMMGLYTFGQTAHTMLGTRTFMGLYLASAVSGSLAQLYYPSAVRQLNMPARRSVPRDQSAVGASAAITGIMTYVCCRIPRGEVYVLIFPVPNMVFLPLLIGGSAYFAYTGGESTYSHAGHLGGALAGLALFAARRGRY